MRIPLITFLAFLSFAVTAQDNCNQILNGNFGTDITNWNAYGCTPVFNSEMMEISSITAGINPWDAAAFQTDLPLIEGQSYTISFEARATANRSIAVKSGLGIAPFTEYFFEDVNLTTEMQQYSFSFTMNGATTNIGSLEFLVGTTATTIFLDNVTLGLTTCVNPPTHPLTGAALENITCITTVQQNAPVCVDEWGMECQYLYDDCIGTSEISPFIHVDQFGYRPADAKWAVLTDPEVGYNSFLNYTPSTTIEVRNAETNAVVYSAAPVSWNNGATHEQSGDRGWWFDFSTITSSGSYYVFDATNNQRSATFEINENIYQEVLKHAGRMFYYNRSGIAKAAPFAEPAWTDGIDFNNLGQYTSVRSFFDQDNPATTRDLSGGWWDAGDYNKYVTFTNSTLHNMMWAFIENRAAFTDDWNIPESGNGIPDILDEIKWELDWLFKMNNPNGSTILKVGSLTFDVNESAPPSSNTTEPFFYISECSSAAIAVAGTFAQAAKMFSDYPAMTGFAQELEQRAITTWNFVLPALTANQLDENCDNMEVVAGDADWTASLQRGVAVAAAIHLYDLTGDQSYHDYIISNIADTENIANEPVWSPYTPHIGEARLLYTTLNNTDATTRNFILNSFRQTVTQDFGNLYGFQELDLYRSDMPDWGYHTGSNLTKAGFGILNILAEKSNVVPNSNVDFRYAAKEKLHYFHGVNPQGITYLTNMYDYGGDRCVDELFHSWFQDDSAWDNVFTSQFGPAPGYLAGGPNQFYEDYQGGQDPSPPGNQPIQKSYWSFNDYEFPSFAATEPAIYYQAAYLRLLAEFTNVDNPCPLLGTACNDNNSNTENDIVNQDCNCTGTTTMADCNQIINSNFEVDITPWNGYGCTPVFSSGVMEISEIVTGENPWDAGVFQSDQTLTEGQTYTISFDASAATNRSIAIKSGLGVEPFTEYFYEEINLTTQMQSYSFTFTMNNPTTNMGTLEFFVGINSAAVMIDNVSLQIATCTDNTTSIFDVNSELSLSIYPNPSTGRITIAHQEIDFPKTIPIEIIDIWGRVISTKQLSIVGNTTLELTTLSNGIYFLKVGAEVHRFVLDKD